MKHLFRSLLTGISGHAGCGQEGGCSGIFTTSVRQCAYLGDKLPKKGPGVTQFYRDAWEMSAEHLAVVFVKPFFNILNGRSHGCRLG